MLMRLLWTFVTFVYASGVLVAGYVPPSANCYNHLFSDNHGLDTFEGEYSSDSTTFDSTVRCVSNVDAHCDEEIAGTSTYVGECQSIGYIVCNTGVLVRNLTTGNSAYLDGALCVHINCKSRWDSWFLKDTYAPPLACQKYWDVGLACNISLDCNYDFLSFGMLLLITLVGLGCVSGATAWFYLAKDKDQSGGGSVGAGFETLCMEEEGVDTVNEAGKHAVQQHLDAATSWGQLLRSAWDVRSNFQSLWRREPNGVAMLSGMRAVAIVWVLAMHSLQYWDQWRADIGAARAPWREAKAVRDLRHTPLMAFVQNGDMGLDVWLLLSGYAAAAALQREMRLDGRGRIRWLRYILRGFASAVPVGAAALLLTWWKGAQSHRRQCSTALWANALFLNNTPLGGDCMQHTWFIAAELQMNCVSPLIVYAMNLHLVPASAGPRRYMRSRYRGLLVPAALAALVLLLRLLNALNFAQDSHNYTEPLDMYTNSVLRMPPFLAGMAVAYTQQQWVATPPPLRWTFHGAPKRVADVAAGSLLLLLPYVGMIRSGAHVARGVDYSETLSVLLLVFGRPLYGCALAYVCVLAITGHGAALVNKVMSGRAWLPVARLAMSAFLIQFVSLYRMSWYMEVGDADTSWEATRAFAFFFYIGVSYTALLAAGLYVFVERPTMLLLERTSAPADQLFAGGIPPRGSEALSSSY